jgi:hypothetical protein
VDPEEAVVVPLVPTPSEPSTEGMLRMLLNRDALLISRVPTPAGQVASGLVAQTAGAFAKAIGQAAGGLTRSPGSAEGLYRVILPTGAVARDLVPAVGGGFRGIVRAAGSTKLSAHARLVPAVAGTGAAAAAGPLIATVGLAVAGDMLAQHQMNKKLERITTTLLGIENRANEEDRSVLVTAAQQTRKVAGYLLDQARIPAISSAAHAFGALDALANSYEDRLDRWLDVVAKYEGVDRVYAPELLVALVGKRDDPMREFERIVAQMYEGFSLRARIAVLERVAAEHANPDRSLLSVEGVLRDELGRIAARQVQLVGLLDDLSVLQIDASRILIAFAGKGTLEARTTFSRLARALHTLPDGIPVLTDSDQTVLELTPNRGGLSVAAPADH